MAITRPDYVIPRDRLLEMLRFTRRVCILWSVLTAIIGGLRFVDGSVLLELTRAGEPNLVNPTSSYLLDSPLKVWLLSILPSSVLVIAITFFFLALLPLLLIYCREGSRSFFFISILLSVTLVQKISLQNIGVGDGLTIFLIVCAILTSSMQLCAATFFVLGLWHPHQSFFVGFSFIVAQWALSSSWRFRRQFLAPIIGLTLALVVYFIYRIQMVIPVDRLDYALGNVDIVGNLVSLPIAFMSIGIWCYLLRRIRLCGWPLLIVVTWLVVLMVVSLATTDVTRVFCITSLPIVLIGSQRLFVDSENDEVIVELPYTIAIANLLLPVYSWSGFDFFLWPDLVGDFCKYGLHCFKS